MFPNLSGSSVNSGVAPAKANSRGSGSGSGNKDKDDKKNKTSYDTSPRPYTDYQVAKPSLIDVQENSKADRKANKVITSLTSDKNSKASSSGLDLGGSDPKRDSSGDNEDTAKTADSNGAAKKSKTSSYQLPPLFRRSTSNVDPRLRWLLGDQSETAAPGDQSQATDGGSPDGSLPDGGSPDSDRRSAESPTAPANPSGNLAAGRPSNGTPQGPSPARNPGLSKYDYQTIFERGRTLSTRTSYAANPLSVPTTDMGNVPGPMPRAAKDSVSSPAGGEGDSRTMYGPQALTTGINAGYTSGMPVGPQNSGSDISRGSGSYIPSNSLPQLPHYDLHMSRPTGPAALPDPGSRTYDPTRGY
jgi:hypothetical protein